MGMFGMGAGHLLVEYGGAPGGVDQGRIVEATEEFLLPLVDFLLHLNLRVRPL
jgi:hypothetical protein